MNDREYYLSKFMSLDIDEEYKTKLVDDMNNIKYKFPVILNSFHFSNLIGFDYEEYKKILRNPNKFYKEYHMKKKSGGYRVINVPTRELKFLQNHIKIMILDKVNIHESAHGFRKSHSIKTNVESHLLSKELLSLDLENFFPTIKFGRIYYIFNKICGYPKKLSYDFTKLVTKDGSLPQGSPASPIISNIATFNLDLRLSTFCTKLHLEYTRYADDISISSKDYFNKRLILNSVRKIIMDEGFYINNSKTRFQSIRNKLEITGLHIVDESIQVPRKYISKIKQEIYYIKKYGLDSHLSKINIQNRNYLEHLYGKIKFVIYMDHDVGHDLLNDLNKLMENENNSFIDKDSSKSFIKKIFNIVWKILKI